jgi:hypothetical protein
LFFKLASTAKAEEAKSDRAETAATVLVSIMANGK